MSAQSLREGIPGRRGELKQKHRGREGGAPLSSGLPSHLRAEAFLLCHPPYIGKGLLLSPLGCQHSLGSLNYPMDPFLLTNVTLSCSACHFPLLVILGSQGPPEGRNQDWGWDREEKTAKEGLMET